MGFADRVARRVVAAMPQPKREPHEFQHNFGAVTAATAAAFSIEDTFRGNANIPATARIGYAIVRNDSSDFVTVLGGMQESRIQRGERKRVEFPHGGARFFTLIPNATTLTREVTADVGIVGCLC